MKNELLTKMTEFEGQEKILVLDSREVAEMMGKEHGDLMKDIQGSGKNLGIIPVLEKGNFPVSKYFIKSNYKVKGNNKTYNCYLCTKMGCEMLCNKLQGEKGILFTARYVERFNQLQQDNKQLENDKEELHKIALSDKELKDRQYEADKVLYGWKSIRSLLENCTYKNIEDTVENIIDFHVNILKKNDRAYSYKDMNKTEYKQAIRDRVFNILEDIYNTTLDGTLRSVVGELRVNNRQNVIETKNRSHSHKINDLENKLEKVCPTKV